MIQGDNFTMSTQDKLDIDTLRAYLAEQDRKCSILPRVLFTVSLFIIGLKTGYAISKAIKG